MMIRLDVDDWEDNPETAIEMLLNEPGDIVIDASGSGPIPAQIAQLLVSAQMTSKARGSAFRLQDPSSDVTASLKVLGLSDLVEEVS